MVDPADTHATNSYFNTQLCCLNEAAASCKVLKLPITGNSEGLNVMQQEGCKEKTTSSNRKGHFGGGCCTVMCCKHESCHAVPPAKGKPRHGCAVLIEE